MNKDIMLCGVGGQGTVLASKIIAAAAMTCGNSVHSAETIGMAQRGGSVTSHVRIGEAFSPLVPFGSAEIILSFEPAEAVRNLGYLKKGGIVITNTVPAKPVTESLVASGYEGDEMVEYLKKKCDCIFIDANEVCEKFGSTKFLNIIMLGIASGTGRLELEKEVMLDELKRRVPAKFVEANLEAFALGHEIGSER